MWRTSFLFGKFRFHHSSTATAKSFLPRDYYYYPMTTVRLFYIVLILYIYIYIRIIIYYKYLYIRKQDLSVCTKFLTALLNFCMFFFFF